MKPSTLKENIKIRHVAKIGRPILVESSPGLGKTRIAEQVASELKIGFKVILAPLLQPEDYGLPVVSADKKSLDFLVSADKFPLENSDCDEEGILLIDEISKAGTSEQKILTNLIHEQEINGKRLKKGWSIVCTGNHAKDRAGENAILGHLGNRVTRLELEASLDDWTQWALQNGIATEVISFLRFRPELLTNYDGQNKINATPRSWCDGVSATLGVIPVAHEFETFRGDVGEAPAVEFLAFLKIFRELPSPDAILINPKTAQVPDKTSIQYAICGALSHRVTPQNFDRAMTYIKRLPPEFSVLFARDCIIRNEKIANTKAYIEWASGDGKELLS